VQIYGWSRCAHCPGKYKPFSIIVRDEGADAEALTAAINIVKSCINLTFTNHKLKGEHPWFRLNAMSKRLEWMHLDTTYSDLYTESHMTEETRTQETPGVALENEPLTPVKGTPAVEPGSSSGRKRDRELELAGAGRGGKPAKGSVNDEGKADDATKKRKKEEQARWSKLMMLREKMRSVTGSAKDVDDLIKSSDGWAWAR
jgi:hypothetical protein